MAAVGSPSPQSGPQQPDAVAAEGTRRPPLTSLPRFIEVASSDDEAAPALGLSEGEGVGDAAAPRYDYSGQLAHLAVLASLYYASLPLGAERVAGESFLLLVLAGVVLVGLSLAVVPVLEPPRRRAVVLLADLAWVLAALWLGQGLQVLLLPLLFVIVAMAAWRGERWELALVLLLVMAGLLGLAMAGLSGSSVATVAVQAVVLAATGTAVRLLVRGLRPVAAGGSAALMEAYQALVQASPDAVLALDPRTFRIQSCNPAAVAYFGDDESGEGLVGRTLDQAITFEDAGFVPTCRERLKHGEAVRAATTTALAADGSKQELVMDLTPAMDGRPGQAIQAIVRVPKAACETETEPVTWPDYDFTSHYIPSLTHELNNHLGAIRLAAELSANTGMPPDCNMIQGEVDHCQQVLQTVVTQMLRASHPPAAATAVKPRCDLGQAVENCLLLAQPQILSEGIQLRLSLPSTGLPTVSGNMHEVQEALVRIILRAARALREKEHPRTLKCHASVHADEVTITFAHGGAGLTWAELAAVNGQAGVVPRGEHRVWGVVREGVARYGGTLSASNSVARGVQFRITLKVADEQVEGSIHEQAK